MRVCIWSVNVCMQSLRAYLLDRSWTETMLSQGMLQNMKTCEAFVDHADILTRDSSAARRIREVTAASDVGAYKTDHSSSTTCVRCSTRMPFECRDNMPNK